MGSDDRDEVGPLPGFETVRELGHGGMGVVYLARQVSLNRMVAIKVLPPLPRAEATTRSAQFRREAELMARVSHPNIVPIYDFGIADGRPYLVMEYVEGGDLRRQIVPGRPMDPARARALLGPVARALAWLHRNGILHRDLKPGNILMGGGRTPKVADFGIATLDAPGGDPTRPGPGPGTPGYVAPEQQYGLKVDERCDQFSLAAIAYELLTGRKALGPFAPPSRHNPGLSRAADEAILRALEEDRDERFATVEEFAEALDQALASSRPRPSVRRRRRVAFVAVPLFVVFVLGLLSRDGKNAARPPGGAFPPAGAALVAGGPGQGANNPVPAPVPDQKAPVPPQPVAAAPPRPEDPPKVFTNSVGMQMLMIMPSEFTMGSTDEEGTLDERPPHRVKLTRPFYLASCEVTNRQFRAFVEKKKYTTDAEQSGLGGHIYDPATKALVRRPDLTFRKPGYGRPPGDDEPVVQVTWADAKAFCDWLEKEEHLPYRLPTEAEWEYACRAGTETRWYTGNDPARLDEAAWTIKNADSHMHPVGKKKPNAWGLYDMHGNAWEWCDDWFGGYPAAPVSDPLGLKHGDKKALRGGSWDYDNLARTRSASRIPDPPEWPHFTHGFRVAIGLRGAP